jgi:hypothetical protein
VTLGIIVPLVLLLVVLLAVGIWYQRTIRDPPNLEMPTVSSTRFTAEALHRLPSPPWRVVYEIGDQLDGLDHIVIGPIGVVAVSTNTLDRPTLDQVAARGLPTITAASAITRGRVVDLLTGGMSCDTLAQVYWGTADPQRHPAEHAVHATPYVEGQRLEWWLTDWAAHAPAVLTAAQVDQAWRSVTVGIGRPDPQ